MGVPTVLVDADGKPIYGEVSDKEILAHLDRHSQAVMKDFYRTSDFCGACHKAALPKMLNGYKWQRAIFLSDEWQQASFAKQSPLPFYVKPQVSTCQTCHMAEEDIEQPDYGSQTGKLMSHRWLGANANSVIESITAMMSNFAKNHRTFCRMEFSMSISSESSVMETN